MRTLLSIFLLMFALTVGAQTNACTERCKCQCGKCLVDTALAPLPSSTKTVRRDGNFTRPEFPGGNAELMDFISSNLQYPPSAAESEIQGRVLVGFTVEADSTITNVRVIRSVDPSLDKEAIRLVRSMPKWVPATEYGKPVAASYSLPVTFRLKESKY